MTTDTPQADYILGLDLGQAADFTAVAVLERQRKPRSDQPKRFANYFAVRHLKRWPLGSSYTTIVADVAALVATPPLDFPTLAVDQTGVGRAVVDMFRQAQLKASLRPILITAGHAVVVGDDGASHVPKKELVSVLQVLLQARRIKIAALPERELLAKELLAFRVKITAAANETFESWRERDHDDLVLAVALAAWIGERGTRFEPPAVVPTPRRGLQPGSRPEWHRTLFGR